jgi:hypothetical protein
MRATNILTNIATKSQRKRPKQCHGYNSSSQSSLKRKTHTQLVDTTPDPGHQKNQEKELARKGGVQTSHQESKKASSENYSRGEREEKDANSKAEEANRGFSALPQIQRNNEVSQGEASYGFRSCRPEE